MHVGKDGLGTRLGVGSLSCESTVGDAAALATPDVGG